MLNQQREARCLPLFFPHSIRAGVGRRRSLPAGHSQLRTANLISGESSSQPQGTKGRDTKVRGRGRLPSAPEGQEHLAKQRGFVAGPTERRAQAFG